MLQGVDGQVVSGIMLACRLYALRCHAVGLFFDNLVVNSQSIYFDPVCMRLCFSEIQVIDKRGLPCLKVAWKAGFKLN